MNSTSTAPGPAQIFALILDGLRAVIAARLSRPRSAAQLAAFPVLLLLWHRLGRLRNRFASLVARVAAGPRPPRPIRPVRADRPAREPRPKDLLPRGSGWVVRLLAWEAAAYGSQLHHFLSQPEMTAFLEASPQAGRLLRPLCRMLGQPEPARPKPKPAAPAAQEAPSVATPPPAPPALPGASDPTRPPDLAGKAISFSSV